MNLSAEPLTRTTYTQRYQLVGRGEWGTDTQGTVIGVTKWGSGKGSTLGIGVVHTVPVWLCDSRGSCRAPSQSCLLYTSDAADERK